MREKRKIRREIAGRERYREGEIGGHTERKTHRQMERERGGTKREGGRESV